MSQSSTSQQSAPSKRRPVTVTVLPHLKKAGVKVRIKHYRYCSTPDEKGNVFRLVTRANRATCGVIAPRGGQTTIELTFPDAPAGYSFMGMAKCSLTDAFDRREGIRIALQRAVQDHKQMKKQTKQTLQQTAADLGASCKELLTTVVTAFSRPSSPLSR